MKKLFVLFILFMPSFVYALSDGMINISTYFNKNIDNSSILSIDAYYYDNGVVKNVNLDRKKDYSATISNVSIDNLKFYYAVANIEKPNGYIYKDSTGMLLIKGVFSGQYNNSVSLRLTVSVNPIFTTTTKEVDKKNSTTKKIDNNNLTTTSESITSSIVTSTTSVKSTNSTKSTVIQEPVIDDEGNIVITKNKSTTITSNNKNNNSNNKSKNNKLIITIIILVVILFISLFVIIKLNKNNKL